ncbi:hypothetical protein BAE44_0007016 [Dichanthelium oligosanthes]|uniref:Uncharacterized protein n=1 Tax=Dichanthelium oligosanthes TaxID=888268 RepID=A0A1E5W3T4_9POAL|nr:hypothetical protein BAE44_0007016 [Dichanthelium oligosanthes]
MARSEAAIQANEERQDGYKHGLQHLQTIATSLGPLPPAVINFKLCCSNRPGDLPFDLITLLGDESRIFYSDSAECSSFYDADSHSVITVPNLRAHKGRGTIPISITRAAVDGSPAGQCDSLYVIGLGDLTPFISNCPALEWLSIHDSCLSHLAVPQCIFDRGHMYHSSK